MGDVLYSETRESLVAKRHVRNGWLATGLTVIVPVFVVWALIEGILAISKGRSNAGWMVIGVAVAIAAVRFYFYARTGFTDAF